MRKIILSVLAIILIIGAVLGARYIISSKEKPKSVVKKEIKIVETDTIRNSTVPIIISANGNLRAKKRIELYAEVSGVFKSTNKLYRTGQQYRAGETIIRIENSEFYAQVQSARSNLNNQITAIMPDLRLDYSDSFQQWQDYLDSWSMDKNTPALPQAVNDKEKYFITGRNIYSTYYDLKNLENRLSKFRIRAPYTGIITEAMVTEGTLVRNGQQLGEFIKTGTYEMQVSVSATFADLLKVGSDVQLANISNTKIYNGTITRVNGKIDAASQTIVAIIEVKDAALKEGMYLTANLDVQEVDDAIKLDRSLLLDQDKLFIVENGKLKSIKVQPIHFTDDQVIVTGLSDNTVILSRTLAGAYDGLSVMTEQEAQKQKEQQSKSEKNNKED